MIRRYEKPSDIVLKFLTKLNLNQKELSVKVGVSTSMINHIINNRKPITPKLAIELSRVFRGGISDKKLLAYQVNFLVDEQLKQKYK